MGNAHMTGQGESPISNITPNPAIDVEYVKRLLGGPKVNPMEAVGWVDENWLKGSDGTGMHYIFPLAGMQNVGEFYQGVLSVLAPNAKVTLMPTPNYGLKGFEANEQAELAKAVGSDDKEFFLLDNVTTVDPLHQMRDNLPGPLRCVNVGGDYPPTDFVPRLPGGFREVHSRIDKKYDGTFCGGRGEILEYLLGQDPFTYQILKRNGDALFSTLSLNPERYFKPEELEGAEKVYTDPPNKYYKFIMDHIRQRLKPDRQRELIEQLKGEDERQAQAIRDYGVHCAREYLKTKTG